MVSNQWGKTTNDDVNKVISKTKPKNTVNNKELHYTLVAQKM